MPPALLLMERNNSLWFLAAWTCYHGLHMQLKRHEVKEVKTLPWSKTAWLYMSLIPPVKGPTWLLAMTGM